VTLARGRTTFFEGKLLDADDLRLEQEALPRRRVVELAIEANGETERWTEVGDLTRSGPGERHFTLDRETGKVVFGDGTHGRRPEAGGRVEAFYTSGPGRRALVAIPFAAGIAGFLAALFRHRR
jgi:hypothetical protein